MKKGHWHQKDALPITPRNTQLPLVVWSSCSTKHCKVTASGKGQGKHEHWGLFMLLLSLGTGRSGAAFWCYRGKGRNFKCPIFVSGLLAFVTCFLVPSTVVSLV